jgi:hypothetical protein
LENGGAQEDEAQTGLSIQFEGGKNQIHPTIHIKRIIIDSPILQIMRVSSQMVAFRRELRIHGF